MARFRFSLIPSILVAIIAINVTFAHAASCESIDGVKFSAKDKELLITLKENEASASVGGFIADWAPLILYFSDPSVDALYSFATTDWETATSASSNLEKAAACANKRLIEYHMVSNATSGKRYKFFRCLQKVYVTRCKP